MWMLAAQRGVSKFASRDIFRYYRVDTSLVVDKLYTVGPLIIESLWAKKRVSTGALRALDNQPVVQTKI